MKYVDPDGRDILEITSRQYQNSRANVDIDIGEFPSGGYSLKAPFEFVPNKIGTAGCLFVAAVNIGNSYNQANSPQNYKEQSVAFLAKNDKYFSFFMSKTTLGTDFNSGEAEIQALLKDMTGKKFSVERYPTHNFSKLAIENTSKNKNLNAYFIAEVGGHFINVTGIDSEGKLQYFDPYIRHKGKNYTWNDVKGIYAIKEE